MGTMVSSMSDQIAKRLAKKSKLTKKDVQLFNDVVKSAAAKRFLE